MSGDFLTVFGTTNRDEALEILENTLFELKQFLVSKPVLKLTFEAKAKKIEPFSIFEKELSIVSKEIDFPEINFDNEDTLLISWRKYNEKKAFWKLSIQQSTSPKELISLIEWSLKLENAFAKLFVDLNFIDDTPVFGKALDEMFFTKELKFASTQNIIFRKDIIEKNKLLSPAFLLAIKRLSLLPNYL